MASKKKLKPGEGLTKKVKSKFDKKWILAHAIPEVRRYNGTLTIRALHYRLVSMGMTNNMQHYKNVVAIMGQARWEGLLDFDAFLDHDRKTIGKTDYSETFVEQEVASAKDSIRYWATHYYKNMWENQPYYPEVFIEKNALIGVFQPTCEQWNVALNPCKGYPSITYLNNAAERFKQAERGGKQPIILYFGDYDCSGEDIPRSVTENLSKIGVEVELKRIMLTEKQVKQWKLPPAPTKETDSRAANWDGQGQVELDAVEPEKIQQLLDKALKELFDEDLYTELKEQEAEEQREYKRILKRDFKQLLD